MTEKEFIDKFIAKCSSPEGKKRAERARKEFREGKFYTLTDSGWQKNSDWPKDDTIRQNSKAEDVSS